MAQRTGDVLLLDGRGTLDAFAIFMHGPGSEGGEKIVYVKFGAASSGERFDRLLDAIDELALARGAEVEAGVSTASADAFERMRSRGYRPAAWALRCSARMGKGSTGRRPRAGRLAVNPYLRPECVAS